MLVSEATEARVLPTRWKRFAKYFAAVSILALLAFACVAAVNAAYPSGALFTAAQVLSVTWLVFGFFALVAGTRHLLLAKPKLLLPILFTFFITGSVLAAHFYTVNSPASTTSGSLSGSVGANLSNQDISVTSSATGSRLTVTIDDTGSNPISLLQVSIYGTPLPNSNLSLDPSLSSWLDTGQQTSGSWNVQVTNGSQLSVGYQYLSCFSGSSKTLGCIMDEVYYVPAALNILKGQQCSAGADNCNLEHPFLSKALIAAGMAAFGIDTFGWRMANIILGTFCIPLVFILVRHVSGNNRFAYFSAILLATDTMFFVHSSAALIDIPAIFFTILAFVFYFWKSSYWKVDNLMASGIFLGFALLAKETSIFLIFGLVTYHFYASRDSVRRLLLDSMKIMVPAALVFAGGLQVYATLFTSSSTPTFVSEIEYILKYGGGLTGPGWYDAVLKSYITPLNWLTYYTPVSYLVTHVTTTVNSASGSTVTTFVGVGYYGITNPIVTWVVFAWVPIVIYRAIKKRPEGEPVTGDDTMGRFILFWFLWGYLPYIPLWIYGRVTYPFYVLPIVPALAIGAAYFITRPWFPSKVAIIYVLAAFGWFFLYFPLKDFLPDWIRALLGR